MDWKIIVAAPVAAWLVVANAGNLKMPYMWGSDVMASSGHAYQLGLDPEVTYNGRPAITVRSTGTVDDTDFGAANSFLDSTGYEGHRVRLRGMLRTAGVATYAGVFLRANRSDRREWNFAEADHLPRGSAATTGDSDWHPVSVVIEVPAGTTQLGTMDMGLVLVGRGQAWLSDLHFDEVGDDVPVTTSPIGLDPVKYASKRDRHAASRLLQSRQQPANLALDMEPAAR